MPGRVRAAREQRRSAPRPLLVARSGALSAATWRRRHRTLVALLVVHVLAAGTWLAAAAPALVAVAAAGALAALVALSVHPRAPLQIRATAAAAGLTASSIAFVVLSRWEPGARLHGFVVLALVALYHQRRALVTAAVGLGALQVAVVVLDPRPWAVVGVGFVVAAALTHLVGWRLEEHARRDHLTGLAGRSLFSARLHQAVERNRSAGRATTVLLLDLDGFKQVNDSHGHTAGDELLVAVAGRLQSATREADEIARLGGDEFAVLLERAEPGSAERVAGRICETLAQPFVLADAEVSVTGSVGVVSSVDAGARELVARADAAMYEAKRAGKQRWSRWHDGLAEELARRSRLLSQLRDHVEAAGGLPLAYTSVHAVPSGDLAGFVTAARWSPGGQGEQVDADELAGLIDESGLAPAVGLDAVDRALAQARDWRATAPELFVTVDVSSRQLEEPGWAEQVAARAADVGPRGLWVRVLEPTLQSGHPTVVRSLQTLHEAGCVVSLRGFGGAATSLAALQSPVLGAVELDRALTSDVLSKRREWAVATGVMTVARALDILVVAMGVDVASDREELAWLGVDVATGPAVGSDPVGVRSADRLVVGG